MWKVVCWIAGDLTTPEQRLSEGQTDWVIIFLNDSAICFEECAGYTGLTSLGSAAAASMPSLARLSQSGKGRGKATKGKSRSKSSASATNVSHRSRLQRDGENTATNSSVSASSESASGDDRSGSESSINSELRDILNDDWISDDQESARSTSSPSSSSSSSSTDSSNESRDGEESDVSDGVRKLYRVVPMSKVHTWIPKTLPCWSSLHLNICTITLTTPRFRDKRTPSYAQSFYWKAYVCLIVDID